jgi:hypothetical protein
MSVPTPEELEDLLHVHADKLMEHFDSVRIFCTRHTGENSVTAGCSAGRGNHYATLGLVKEWIIDQDKNSNLKDMDT